MAKKTHISKTDETKNESGIRIQSSSPSSVVSNSFTIDSTNNELYFENKVLKPQLSSVVLTGTVIDITNSNNFTANITQDTTFSFTGNEDGRTISVFLKNTSSLIFQGKIAGMSTDVIIKAAYTRPSELYLLADGIKTINQIISSYNSTYTPLSPVFLASGDGTQIPTPGFFKLSQKDLNVSFNGVNEIINNNPTLKFNGRKIYSFKFMNGLIYGELKVNVNKFIKNSAGANHSLALKADGRVFAWGANTTYGHLGDNTIVNKSSPVQVVGQSDFVAIAGGTYHSVALKADGRVFSWGSNTYGQIGDSIGDRSSPVQVVGQSNFVAISAGIYHSVALKSDGRIFSWGYNNSGQLGDNTVVNKNSPVQVVGQSDFVAIAAGGSYCIALKSNGTVWSWGYNGSGQLGDNTIVNKSSPVQVVGQSDFIIITTGTNHCLALKANGTIWSWGDNTNGQLGDNTIVNKSSPIQVIGQSNFAAIAAGGNASLALKADGTVWSWGDNTNGQLGDNTVVAKSSPVQVVGQSDFVAIAGGSGFFLALKADGTIFTWGLNGSGQLGDNTIVNKSSPVQIIKL